MGGAENVRVRIVTSACVTVAAGADAAMPTTARARRGAGGRPHWSLPSPAPGGQVRVKMGENWRIGRCPASLVRAQLTGMRDKPRRRGRGRIAPGSLSEPCQTMLLQESCRERDLPPGKGKVTPAEIRAAQQGTRPRNPAVPAAQAAQSESPGLQAGDVGLGDANSSRRHCGIISQAVRAVAHPMEAPSCLRPAALRGRGTQYASPMA